jgi:alpha-1,2-mannosyltransferase
MTGFLLAYDFYYLWAAGNLVKKGSNPYAIELFNQELTSIGWPATEYAIGLSHPPINLWLYRVAAIMPFKIALVGWLLLSALIPIYCAQTVARIFFTTLYSRRLLLVFATISFPPVVSNLLWGQVNALLLLGVSLFAALLFKKRYYLAGIALSIVVLKPHLFIPLLAVIMIEEIACQRYKLLLGLLFGFVLQLLASLILCPGSIDFYINYLPTMIGELSQLRGATLAQMIELEFGLTFVRPVFMLVGILLGMHFTRRFGYTAKTLMLLLLPLSLIVCPYAWSHSMVILLPAYLSLVNRAAQSISEKKLIYLLTLFSVVGIPITLLPSVQYTWILLPIIVLLLNLVLAEQFRKLPHVREHTSS